MLKKTMTALLGSALMLGSASAVADPSTRDWLPAPPGTDIIATYFGHERSKNRFYVDGNRVSEGPDLSVNYALYRQMHYREIAGKTVQFEVIAPISRISAKAGGEKERLTGIGDVNLGAAIWLLNDDETRTYFAYEPFIILPTGRYRAHQADVSPGENRWGMIHDFAFVKGIGESTYLEGMVEFEFFGKNNNYYGSTLKKKPVTRLMGFVSTDLSDSTYAGLRYRYEMGGKERINGETVMGSLSNHQLAADITHQINDHNQIQLRYARDIRVKNGPKFHGLQFRYAYIF